MRRLLPVICSCALAAGCSRTIYIPVESARTETSASSAAIRDSVYVSDTVRIFRRGDTIMQQAVRTVRRDRTVTDTVIISRSDTVTIHIPEPTQTHSRHGPSVWNILASILPILLIAGCIFRYFRNNK